MLEVVSKGFASAREALTGRTTLTAENIDTAVRAIRVALLEADVELGVVKSFVGTVRQRALGEVVQTRSKGAGRRSPGDHFTYICHKELTNLLGQADGSPITFFHPATVIMLVGLQGVGKTTTCAKLAKTLKNGGRRPLMVAADTQRPAAQQQLNVLGQKIDVPVFFAPGMSPSELCEAAKNEAKTRRCDVILLDTAGRLTIDAPLMEELAGIRDDVKPHEVLLVCDAMAGQDTVQTARQFDAKLNVTGFIMTKLDGDARGGAALSLRAICRKPIKFLGTGEGLEALERFRPEGLSSRILGMGDLVGLMEDFEQVIDEKQAEKDSKKLLRGDFGFDDFLSQLRLIKKMGPLKHLAAKMPGLGGQGAQIDEKQLKRIEALIQSMTPAERKSPQLIDPSRSRRIARGAGQTEDELKKLLERFASMQQMVSQLARQPGLLGGMPNMGGGGLGSLKKMFGKGGFSGQLPGAAPPAGPVTQLPGLGRSAGSQPSMPSGLASMMGPSGGGAGQPDLSNDQQATLERLQAMMGQGRRTTGTQRDRQRSKDKRKAEKKARKKARR